MKQLKSHVRHDDPEIMSISHIHVLILSTAISLIVSLTFPSWSPVPVLNIEHKNAKRLTMNRVMASCNPTQVADHVIMMDCYSAHDVTDKAKVYCAP